MADPEVLTEQDDDIVIVETDEEGNRLGEPTPQQEETPPEDEGDDHDEGDDDHEDEERLGQADEEDEDPARRKAREKRQRRRELQRKAREHQENEMRRLAQANEFLAQRLGALEGHTLSREQQSIEIALQQAEHDMSQAERILAAATSAGNGDDAVTAMRIRDAARDRAIQLRSQREAFNRQPEPRQQQPAPQMDQRTVSWGQQWMQANPWYKADGSDEDSAIVNAIDARMTAEGHDPTQRAYWEELSRRVGMRMQPAADDDHGGHVNQRDAQQQNGASRRKGPPLGNGREHAPASTRREVMVTPARKQAMQDAGVWDDPVARARYLKSYEAYDKANSAR